MLKVQRIGQGCILLEYLKFRFFFMKAPKSWRGNRDKNSLSVSCTARKTFLLWLYRKHVKKINYVQEYEEVSLLCSLRKPEQSVRAGRRKKGPQSHHCSIIHPAPTTFSFFLFRRRSFFFFFGTFTDPVTDLHVRSSIVDPSVCQSHNDKKVGARNINRPRAFWGLG